MKNRFEKYGKIKEIFDCLPPRIAEELEKRMLLFGDRERVTELRLRAGGVSSLRTLSGTRPLGIRLTEAEISEILTRLTGGSLYAFRDTLAEGYVTARSGMRVGVCGRARYDGGSFVGTADVRSLVFRISNDVCDFEAQLRRLWHSGIGSGLLLYSAPCGGKTTAIRRLASIIAEEGKHVCVVDERCEFVPSDYTCFEVDLLRGYKKSKGIEIAVRTLGAEVVIVDEIGAEEAGEVLGTLMLGVPLVCTAHAASLQELTSRPAFAPFLSSGVFQTAAGIVRRGDSWSLEVTKSLCRGKDAGVVPSVN